ncbi:MAG: murein biosynthesis integral membrane protein MurJ [Thermorudis peleae]|nr:murein biosynthesis integral membrane protein MurJ [Thermorudis peleae]
MSMTAQATRSERRQMVRAAALLMVGTLLSRLLGLAREQVNATLFGTGDAIAAFTIADNVQTLLFDLLISGMLQAALVPVLSAYTAPEQRAELRRIVGALLTLAFFVVGAAVLVLEAGAPLVVAVMTGLGGGAAARGVQTVALTVQLVRWILPATLLLAWATILMGTLYALDRFARPALALATRNAAIVVAALLLGHTLGVRSLVLGTLAGALLLTLVQLGGLRDLLPRPNLGFGHPAIRRVLRLYVPIFLGLIANTAAVILDRNLAWGVSEDALGAMRYATALNQMVLGLVAAATSLAALPQLARHFAAGDELAYQRTLGLGLKLVGLLIFPATLGLAAIGWPAVTLIYFHGATDLAGAHAIWVALLGYLPGTLCAAFDQVVIFAFYARQNTRTPVIVGVLAVGIYLVTALLLVHPLGMLGLVLANSAQFIGHLIIIGWLLHRELGSIGDPTTWPAIGRAALAAVIMAAVVFVVTIGLRLVRAPESAGLSWRLLTVGVPVVIGALVYWIGLRLLQVEEAQLLVAALRARLLNR